jgi:ABC-type transport system involved in resistance to organic solvents, periplasmic component
LKLSRELKVGFIAILALAALYWGLNYLKGSNLFDNHRYFYAIYSRIDGLKAARPVNINGFQVGQVDEIYFHPNNTGQLVVKIAMTNDFSIPRDSKARIYSSDLLGEKAIELDLGRSAELAAPGDTLISDIQLSLSEEVNKQVAPIKEKAEKLIGSIDTVMILASGFLTEETKNNFTRTFESIRRSFATLEHSMKLVRYHSNPQPGRPGRKQ